MVMFTCNQCGQAVKKNQVESHCNFQCRNCQSLSCMDCGKEFWGDDYKQHTKCITEDQKYGGKNYVPKPSSNKGEVKQEKWIEHIRNVISTKKLSGPLSQLLGQIVEYSNIPRKKSKFENFLKNSLKLRNPKLIGEAWEIFAQSTAHESNAQSPAVNGNSAGLKRPLDEKNEPPNKKPHLNGNVPMKNSDSIQENHLNSFNWVEVIKRILSQNSDNALPMYTLRKKVLAEYKASVKNSSVSKEDFKKKLKEVLTSSDQFVVNKTQ